MKIIHLADIHYSRERKDLVISSLNHVKETVKKNAVDLIVIAGDLFDSATLNTANAGFPEFLDAIKELADQAPVAMVYGTPSHDVDQSLDVFPKITTEHNITVLEPGQAYFLTRGRLVTNELMIKKNLDYNEPPDAIIFGIPEPRKKYLLAGNSAGKDETEETIRDAMHKLCFLLAAKRKEYADIPCVVLYHGDVAGSSMQNNQTVERGTGISITADDLSDIGADFNCLGHIHLPQQIGNLPAYYAGSITKNFGEQHKAGYNLVDVDVGSYKMQRIDWPIPQNIKIAASLDDWRGNPKFMLGVPEENPENDPVGNLDIRGKKVWLEITCKKEDRAFLDADGELQTLFQYGAVEGSRVTISEIAVETVRAAEITEVNTPTKKYEVWAQNSNLEVEPSVLDKIKTLETEVMKGTVRAAGEWELASLKLRGAIGIKKGVGKDEICLNLHNYDPGLIALVGSNGRGKTTLIENCHPYPQLLTRKGKLQDHFCLRDSYREVIYEDRSLKGRGHFVKFLIQIDGQNKSGSCKYFIFDARGFANLESINEWVPRPGVDGTLKPYEEELGGIFGPVELYLRTAFSTQRPTKNLPDLTDATAGEKKTLFVELAGIDYLQQFSEAASEKAKTEAAKNHDAQIKVQMLEGAVARKETETQALKDTEKTLAAANAELEKVTAQGKTAAADKERCQGAWNAEELRQSKENDARKAVDQVMGEIQTLKGDIQRYEEAVRDKSVYESEISAYESLKKTVDAENAKKQKHLEANMEKQQGYLKEKSSHDEKMNTLKVKRDNLSDQRNSTERLVQNANANIKLYERDAAEIKDNCPTCGQKLPEAKLAELKARRDQFVEKINKEKAEVKKHETKLAEITAQIENINNEIADLGLDEPTPVSLKPFDERVLQYAAERMNNINIAQSRARLEKANEANVRIEGLKNQLTDKQKLLDERSKTVRELTAGVDENTFGRLRRELDEAIVLHSKLTEKYTEIKAEIAGWESTINSFRRTLAEIEKQEKELDGLKKAMLVSEREETAWDLISKAFGRDGIQALELDALAPGISDTANKILESAYGDRFRIAIETTRIGGAGSKKKQIEDFLIFVTDFEDSERRLLENLSGGESVWVKRAIYDAFAIIRKRNTGFIFLTCIQDEADGALDSASKAAYFTMLSASHREGNLKHTIVITHSQEALASIDQKILMEAI